MDKQPKHNEIFNIREVIADYIKNWYWFAISIVLFVGLAYVYAKTHPQKNQICASILVTQDDGTASMLNGLGGLLGADPYVQDEIFVITSHAVLKSVVEDLGIYKTHIVKNGLLSKRLDYPDFPVDVLVSPEIADTLSTSVNFKIQVKKGGEKADIVAKAKKEKIADLEDVKLPATIKTIYGEFIVAKTDHYPGKEELTTWVSIDGYDGAAESLALDLMSSIASKKSNVIELAIESTNPVYGCDILNNILAVYNARGIQERNFRAMKTAAFIQERLNLIAADLSNAESDIESYKENNRLIDVSTEAQINTRLKNEYETRLVGLQTQQEIIEMTINFLSSPDNKYELVPDVSFFGNDGEKESLKLYNEMVLKRMTMLTGAKPDNRNIRDLEAQIDALRANLLVAADRALKYNRVSIKDAQKQADMAMAKLGNVPSQEREFLGLKRQQEVKQQLYLFLLQRNEETAMLIANAIPKGTIIDPAYVRSEPVGTSKLYFLIIGLFVGVFVPIIALYFKSLMRTKVESRADIEKRVDLPILGEICEDKSGEKIVVGSENTSPTAELFRMVRANLQFVLAKPEDKVVMVTSSVSGEGKSFIAINLAASLSLINKKVVIVGVDIRKPQLANYLGLPASPGLTQFLSNPAMSPDEIIRQFDGIDNLNVIVAGPIPPNPGELMTSPRISEMIDYLRQHYDYVILDSAPVGMVSDSFNLSVYVDSTIYVVRNNVTRLQDLDYLNNIVEKDRLKRPGIVINGAVNKDGYGYGYK